MSALAIIRQSTGKLVSLVRSDVPPGWTAPEGCLAIPSDELPADIEREEAGEAPAKITPRQLRLWLLSQGIPLAAVDAQLPSEAARVEWEFALEVVRGHPLVAHLGAVLGLSSAQIDAAFREASTL